MFTIYVRIPTAMGSERMLQRIGAEHRRLLELMTYKGHRSTRITTRSRPLRRQLVREFSRNLDRVSAEEIVDPQSSSWSAQSLDCLPLPMPSMGGDRPRFTSHFYDGRFIFLHYWS
jgi:hypothetical protein